MALGNQKKTVPAPQKDEKKQGPVATFRAGGVAAKVWENEVTGKDGKPVTIHNVSITRTYKDQQSGDFKETNSFKQNDLPKVILVAQKAFEAISLKDNPSQENDDQ